MDDDHIYMRRESRPQGFWSVIPCLKSGGIVLALSAAHSALSANISPRELVEWYYGDVASERAKEIETTVDPYSIKHLMWVSGYFDQIGKSPVPKNDVALVHAREHQPEAAKFIDEFCKCVAERQSRSEEGVAGQKKGPKGVIGDWPTKPGRSPG